MSEASLFRAPLFEKYRPATWQEVVGQEKLVCKIRQLIDRGGLARRAYWLSGGSGQGETSVARLIAHEVADDFFIQEIDASSLTIAQLKEIERDSQLKAWGERNGRAYLVNESHGLRKDVIRQLLVMLERIPAHCCWVFTTTNENQEALFEDCLDASPLLSRCITLPLARRGLAEAFAVRAKEIAEKEGLDGKPIKDYLRLVNENRSNFRAVLQAIESGEMTP